MQFETSAYLVVYIIFCVIMTGTVQNYITLHGWDRGLIQQPIINVISRGGTNDNVL